MPENATKEVKAVPQTRPGAEDLSKEIEHSIERQPDERCRVVRVFDNCYRCNWWVQDKTPHPAWLAAGTIRRSRLVRGSKINDKLLIEDVK